MTKNNTLIIAKTPVLRPMKPLDLARGRPRRRNLAQAGTWAPGFSVSVDKDSAYTGTIKRVLQGDYEGIELRL